MKTLVDRLNGRSTLRTVYQRFIESENTTVKSSMDGNISSFLKPILPKDTVRSEKETVKKQSTQSYDAWLMPFATLPGDRRST